VEELRQLGPAPGSPIHITHTKPAETADIAAQLQALGAQAAEPQDRRWHWNGWLRAMSSNCERGCGLTILA
jgi:hypothetical protein